MTQIKWLKFIMISPPSSLWPPSAAEPGSQAGSEASASSAVAAAAPRVLVPVDHDQAVQLLALPGGTGTSPTVPVPLVVVATTTRAEAEVVRLESWESSESEPLAALAGPANLAEEVLGMETAKALAFPAPVLLQQQQ